MLKELEPDAHFVTYAPPAFIPFHHQIYLEFSMTTALTEPPEPLVTSLLPCPSTSTSPLSFVECSLTFPVTRTLTVSASARL